LIEEDVHHQKQQKKVLWRGKKILEEPGYCKGLIRLHRGELDGRGVVSKKRVPSLLRKKSDFVGALRPKATQGEQREWGEFSFEVLEGVQEKIMAEPYAAEKRIARYGERVLGRKGLEER